MEIYSIHQWLLFFYLYCFLGWIWETSYVSIKRHKFVNRGFLHGPFLPIYGSGAIIVLLAIIPFKSSPVLVFIFGLIAATVLEYFTGMAMENLFHVRYWDYTKDKFNLNGYICLKSSITWGVFSLLLIYVVQPPIQDLVFKIPNNISEILALLITVGITADSVQSFNEAMDLKQLLIKYTQNNEEILRIQNKLESMAKLANENVKELKEKAELTKKLGEYKFMKQLSKASNSEYYKSLKILRRNPSAVTKKYAKALEEILKK